MRRARLTALLITLLALSAAPAHARGRVVMHLGFMYKPHEFPVSGDGDFIVRGLRWRSWGDKQAVASGQAVEQVRPSHVDHTYPVRVTLSHRTFCASLHRTVYNKITARILGPSAGVFGSRTLGRVYTCAGTWQLTTADTARAATGRRCSRHGMPLAVRTISALGGATCVRARTIVRAWFHRLKAGANCVPSDGATKPGMCTVDGWRCRSPHTVNGHTYTVTCTAPVRRRHVRFVNLV